MVDLSSGQKREVEPAQAKVGIGGAKFSRDGQGVYLISNRDSEFAQLRYVGFFTNEKTVVSGHLAWDVEELALSRDGHYLAYVSNENGAGKLNLLDLRTHQDLIPPKLPGSGIVDSLSFDAEGRRLAFGFASPNQPRDAYVLDIAANGVEPWTRSEAGAVDLAKFAAPRLAQFPTFDRPDGRPAPGTRVPLRAVESGTASGVDRPARRPRVPVPSRLRSWIQYVVNELGFTVAAPNVRGSAGYGKSYAALDNGTLREDAVKDVGALLVWLGLQSGIDAKHIVVSGESYGGYLALAALVNYGDRLRAASTWPASPTSSVF